MALVLNDRVKETSTTTGTGTLNLDGAATGFQTFVAGVANGNTTYYCIQLEGGSQWEVGIGTVGLKFSDQHDESSHKHQLPKVLLAPRASPAASRLDQG